MALTALATPGVAVRAPQGLVGEELIRLLFLSVWESTTEVAWGEGTCSLAGVQTPLGEARVVRLRHDDGRSLAGADRGSELRPESAATVLITGGGTGLSVSLRGPGIDGVGRTELPLSPGLVSVRNEACSQPPCGVDLLIFDDDAVIGLPRTTIAELGG